jgi:peptidoglycan/xylan/chitin deacetylase (PgdA/CDA1 family)
MLYVRSATTPGGTVPLIREPDKKLDKPADYASRADSSVPGVGTFTHGSRTAARVVALTFDAMDSLDGLPVILETLERYKIRATFFINGEFIRQHPAAVNEIVKAGHQTASLFFTTWDLSGTKYRIDGDFIVRGLSRNEDDFYNATGQELTLLWHAPYYVDSPMINEAGEKAGYRYVASDVSVLDWVTAETNRSLPGLCKDSATIIEDILAAKKPGSIIPVRIGKSEGSRPDYLYNKIEVLVNALIEDGYDIVSVEELIKNAR